LEDGIIVVRGTNGSDNVLIAPVTGQFTHRLTGYSVTMLASNDQGGAGTFLPISEVRGIRVELGAGNDYAWVRDPAGEFDLPVTLIGGDGRDTLVGGRMADLIDGGAGADSIDGGGGEDQIIDPPPPPDFDATALVDRNDVFQGTARIDDGILHVVTTGRNDEIQIGSMESPGEIYVLVNGANLRFDAALVRRILVDAGDGNDGVYYYNRSGLVNLPATINGGAGDDELYAEDAYDLHFDPIAFREHQASYAGTVLDGGDGNDRLTPLIGDATLIGGAGDDQFDTGRSWGANTIIDDQFAPPVAAPVGDPAPAAPMGEQALQPAATDDGASPAAANPPAVPLPFSTAAVPLASGSVFGDGADDVWDALG
jgi:Ca2+-binding RTX toxin-like protein